MSMRMELFIHPAITGITCIAELVLGLESQREPEPNSFNEEYH